MTKRTWIERAAKRASIIVMCAACVAVLQGCHDGGEDVMAVDGADGKDGPPGPAGKDGRDGTNGTNGMNGLDGSPGPRGLPGEAGLPGPSGRDGKDGLDGEDGLPGPRGLPGEAGLPGPAGKDGEEGLPGLRGLPGPAGRDGRDGEDGLPGPRGLPGEAGLPGPAGKEGRAGKDGSPGNPGERGEPGFPGPEGLPGRPGLPGPRGADGKDGADAGRVLNRAFQHSSAYAGQCAPDNVEARSARDGAPIGSLAIERNWVRSLMDEVYLWRQDVPYVDVDGLDDDDVSRALSAYLDALRSPAFKPDGKRRDEYTQVVPTSAFNAFMSGGDVPGFGVEWSVGSHTPPRNIRVAFVQPGSEAERQGVKRGDTLVATAGIEADDDDEERAALLAASMFPRDMETEHRFILRSEGDASTRTVILTSGLARQPVPLVKVFNVGDEDVGYLLFQEHGAHATAELVNAINDFSEARIDHLVIDLRFNQGGDLSVASQLAYMVAGKRSMGQAFSRLQGGQLSGTELPFHGCADLSRRCLAPDLPTLDAGHLRRVYVLTQAGTCAASEALINSLRGVGVEVVLIGSTTCGRPYAASPRANCGHTYLPLDHVVSNAQGFSGYGEGFVPGGSGANGVQGCFVVDDLAHELSDPNEALLKVALIHAATGQCRVTRPLEDRSADAAPMAPWRDLLRGGAIVTTPPH
ncbi:S41 family peptidase [Roseateles noduli]|uniref:S41 family peptidase n=1 Tax=Roseateles noduli TaxID=2052484 RepID=UPI003D64C2AF